MAVLIQFISEEDILQGIEFLDEAEETYHGVPVDKFLISNEAARMLSEKNVKFNVIGGKTEEGRYGACP